jgi:hypothetical protein
MLNELYQLSLSLEKSGIKPKDWHKELKPLPNATPKKPCYRILIGSGGFIEAIETMQPEAVACLRKWEPSNGNSFPGFNIQPLYRITNGDRKKQIKKWREGKESINYKTIKEWRDDPQLKNWDEKVNKKLSKCIGVVAQEFLDRCQGIPSSFEAVKILCERVLQWGDRRLEIFLEKLQFYLMTSFEQGTGTGSLIPVLFHEGNADKKQEDDRGSISVFLDIPDYKEYPVAHKETIECINDLFMKHAQDEGRKAKRAIYDAFGESMDGFEDKLPEVKLPVIGGVKLRAMTSESPCQFRYGSIDAKSFFIGAESRRRSKGSLEWMKDDEREGQTWGRADGKELIFAYPAILPKSPPKLASCFGASKADDSEARFEKYAEDVISSLYKLSPSLKDIELRVFSLRKMDKARTKVVFHRNYSAQRLADAAMEWRTGCENIPAIKIDAWGKQKGEIVHVTPETPFPLQISACLNRVWKLDGTTQSEVEAINKSTGIELLLDETANQRLVPHLLSIMIQNGRGLFCSLGQSINRDEVIKLDGLNKHKQLMPSILGLLLWKFGIGKETYMHKAPFLVGKMFKLADEIHALYCEKVRNNHLPPVLVGNSLLTAALETPVQALAQLALRIKPYYGWAQTFRGNENGGLAGYYIHLYAQVATELAEQDLPSCFNDADRAQVLLGYLAANPRKQEK